MSASKKIYAFKNKDDALILRGLAERMRGQSTVSDNQFAGKMGFLLKSGSGGVPARSGSTCGEADDCIVIHINENGELEETDQLVRVKNPWGSAIDGDTYFTAKIVNWIYLIPDATDC